MKPTGIPDNYVQTANGVWCHPSRIKKFGEAFCETFPEPMPPEPCRVPWRDDARKPTKRIRQSSKPLMNKLEAEWFNIVSTRYPNYPRPRAHAITLRLANGVRYSPDLFVTQWPAPYAGPSIATAWEVKGPHAWDDALVKIKVAAHEWPEISFILVWKENNQWKEQHVLP